MKEDAAGVAGFKKEVDAGFDEALAEVSSALDSVPWPAPMTLPGLEPPPEQEEHKPRKPRPRPRPTGPDPLQGRFELDPDDSDDDPITDFAPSSEIYWGPRGLRLTRHHEGTEGDG